VIEILDVSHMMITHVMITPHDSNVSRFCVFIKEVVMCNTDISDYNNVIFVQNVYHYTVNIIIIRITSANCKMI